MKDEIIDTIYEFLKTKQAKIKELKDYEIKKYTNILDEYVISIYDKTDKKGYVINCIEVYSPAPCRVCSECGSPMKEGYCIDGGYEYYCSDECLHRHYTEEEYLELYDNGNSDTYWTEWED